MNKTISIIILFCSIIFAQTQDSVFTFPEYNSCTEMAMDLSGNTNSIELKGSMNDSSDPDTLIEYKDNTTLTEIPCTSGKVSGELIQYYPKVNIPRLVMHYYNGILNGKMYVFMSDGVIAATTTYKNGIQIQKFHDIYGREF